MFTILLQLLYFRLHLGIWKYNLINLIGHWFLDMFFSPCEDLTWHLKMPTKPQHVRGFQEPAALKLATFAQRPTGTIATPTRWDQGECVVRDIKWYIMYINHPVFQKGRWFSQHSDLRAGITGLWIWDILVNGLMVCNLKFHFQLERDYFTAKTAVFKGAKY